MNSSALIVVVGIAGWWLLPKFSRDSGQKVPVAKIKKQPVKAPFAGATVKRSEKGEIPLDRLRKPAAQPKAKPKPNIPTTISDRRAAVFP